MQEHDVISVVGGGWTFEYVDHTKLPGKIIAINEAGVLLLKAPDWIVTMDRLWMENRLSVLQQLQVSTWARKNALQNIVPEQGTWLHPFECDHKTVMFSDKHGTLNGTNSGACGLNWAWQLRPKELYMFGFDMCRSPEGKAYWYPPYPWSSPQGGTSNGKYSTWAMEFNRIAMAFKDVGCKVYNVSPKSKIISFHKISPQDIGVAK